MKHWLICAALIWTCGLSAQDSKTALSTPSAFRKTALHYSNSEGEKGLTTFNHNSDGVLISSLWELDDGSRHSLNTYEYDRKGNMVKKSRTFSDGKTSVQEFFYDKSGRVSRETFSRSDGINGNATYAYNPETQTYTMTCTKHLGWFSGTITYETDSNGSETHGIIKTAKGLEGQIRCKTDTYGNKIEEVWDFPGKWNQTFSWAYQKWTPDCTLPHTLSNPFIIPAPHKRIQKEEYSYDNQPRSPSLYTYLNNDTLQKKEYIRSDGLKTVTYYFYDLNHLLVKSLRLYSDGRKGIFSYSYTPDRQLEKRTFKGTDGTAYSEEYTYNEQGFLESGKWDKMDGWLTGSLTFTHSDGRLNNGTFNSTEKPFTADIQFSYDTENALTLIHWTFSFGKSQDYYFSYEKY